MTTRDKLLELKDSALEASQSGIVITDFNLPDNPIIYVNSAFENMTGYSKEDTLNKNCRFLQGDDKNQSEIIKLKTAIQNGQDCQVVLRNYKKDGTLFYNELFISPVKNSNGEITNYIGIQTDVTKRVIAEKALKDKTQELERSNRDLEQFAYAISHDLQEPLRMVSTFMDLLSERYKDKLDNKANEYISYAVDGSIRMQNLINDLLDYSKIRSSEVKMGIVDLNKVLEEAKNNLGLKIKETNAKISSSTLPTIKGVKPQLLLLFQNLISNSMKYCKSKSPEINIISSLDNDVHCIQLKDNGIGIDSEHFEYIFEIFKRLHPRKDYPGTGVGLAICRKIIENHNGKIWVESELEKGSTFYFTLPVSNEQ